MVGVGFYEICLITLLVGLLWNKKDFAKILFNLGKWYSKFQKMWLSFKNELKNHLQQAEIDAYRTNAEKEAHTKQPLTSQTKNDQ
ncbi:MAG: hypothetical protein C0582_05660 [Alphaproteobacteria bacterium]|nr:MAG: hypothetical protein C0582_05660 [Alphaproteobacteria bacterium]